MELFQKLQKILFLIEDTSELECWHLYVAIAYHDLGSSLDLRSVFDSRSRVRIAQGTLNSRLVSINTSVSIYSSLVSSIKKRIFVIFERAPLTTPGIEPGTFCTEGERLTTWSTQASLEVKVHLVLYIVDAARDDCNARIKGIIQ